MSLKIWKVWKGREKIQKFKYLENEKSFLDEIKNIFNSFWRAIIWWKNKNLIKHSRHKLLPWNISKMILKTIATSIRIVISYMVLSLMETETTIWSEFLNGGKAIVKQIIVSEERNTSKRAELWESQSGIWVGKFTIWVRSFEIYQFHQNWLASPYDGW